MFVAFQSDATNLVTGDLNARADVFIRDRSTQPGCAGCVRITAGVLEHTERCLATMEEILCGER